MNRFRSRLPLLPFLLLLLLVGCTDGLLTESTEQANRSDAASAFVPGEKSGKLRHAQLLPDALAPSSATRAGKWGANDAFVFVAFSVFEPDGVTRRVMDNYGVTRRVLEEYGITRRVLDSYGVTRRVLQEYGVTRRVLGAYGVTRRVLESYGVTSEDFDTAGDNITDDFLAQFGLTIGTLEADGVTRRVLDDYGVTRRVLDDYGVNADEYESALEAYDPDLRLRVSFAEPAGVSLRMPEGLLETMVEEIEDDEDIHFVEPDPAVGVSMLGREGSASTSQIVPWNIDRIGVPLTDYAYNGVEVFVLDSGVMDHDLSISEKKDFTMLFENRSSDTWDDADYEALTDFDPGHEGDPLDHSGHGTHVMGILGAENNSVGILGTAPQAKIHSLKVLTDQGQTDVTTVAAAMNYVIAYKGRYPSKDVVVNLSFGADIESTDYSVFDDVVQSAIDLGITVVVSAGNDGEDASTYSPAHVADAITVGSFGPNDSFSDFSNKGSAVDILAPGEAIVSLSNDPDEFANGMLVLQNGTSMATPHVTGAAAQYLALNPGATPAQVKNALLDFAQPVITDTPGGTTDKALYVGVYARDMDQDYALTVTTAKWESESNTLILEGKSHQWVEVVLRSAGTGTQIGTALTNDLGEWAVSIENPAPNPCLVIAEYESEEYTKSVLHKPLDCEKMFTLESAKWLTGTNELELEGTGPAGAVISYRSGTTGVTLGDAEIPADGNYRHLFPYTETHLVPCVVEALYSNLVATDEVTEDPSDCDYGLEVADQAFYLSTAKYLDDTNQLLLEGKGTKEAQVDFFSTGSGTALGSTVVDYNAEFSVLIDNPAVVPCELKATSGSTDLLKAMSYAPDECEKALSLLEARWYGDDDNFILLEGTGVAGSTLSFTGTALGNDVTTITIDESGLFALEVDWIETHTIPCDVTATALGVTVTHEMRYAPFECDFGMNNAEFAFTLESSTWEDDMLVLEGEGARSATVAARNAASGIDYPATTVYYNGIWQTQIDVQGLVPCAIEVTSNGQTITDDVSSAPGDCDFNTIIEEAEWNTNYRKLTVDGRATKGSTVTFRNAATGEELGTQLVTSGIRKFDLELILADGVAEPCTVQVEAENGQIVTMAVAGATATCQ